MKLASEKPLLVFKKAVYDFYHFHKRHFPWRDIDNPYFILVSEIMLQQTQAHRVIEKYEEFIKLFPTVQSLADASNESVLRVWQGLGYNRRGIFLKKTAQQITTDYHGVVPDDIEQLQKLPGIGYNTACAIAAFAFNKPVVFIETNIRTVFIHHFFTSKESVNDKDILLIIKKALLSTTSGDENLDPRNWYYALMDYGVYLKKNFKNPSRKSSSYSKQSKFEGSKRQVRGEIIKLLLERKSLSKVELLSLIDREELEIIEILSSLEKEGMITHKNQVYTIA
ncbi:MAG: A/G-specific adenine glycosylase [Microgenomates group bacterium]